MGLKPPSTPKVPRLNFGKNPVHNHMYSEATYTLLTGRDTLRHPGLLGTPKEHYEEVTRGDQLCEIGTQTMPFKTRGELQKEKIIAVLK